MDSNITKSIQSPLQLSFSGIINLGLIDSAISTIEFQLDSLETNINTRKKVYGVVVELLQNLYNHQSVNQMQEISRLGVFSIELKKYAYKIVTGNYISNKELSPLVNWIEELNGLSTKEIKTVYNQILTNKRFSAKGGAGLGLINTLRLANNKLYYTIDRIDEQCSFITFEVEVNSYITSLIIEPKTNSFGIYFDTKTGNMKIYGTSSCVDTSAFFNPILAWLERYKQYPNRSILIDINIEYFNTIACKYILDILEVFDGIKKSGLTSSVIINWYCKEEDLEMMEAYQDIENILELKMNLISLSI